MDNSDKEKKRLAQARYRQKHREQKRAYDQAYRLEHKEQIRASNKAYYQAHKEEDRAYRQKHKEKYREIKRRFAARPENREKQRQWLSSPDVRKAKSQYDARPENKEARRLRVIANPEKYRKAANARAYRRRARKHGGGGTHTIQQIAEQLKRQKYRCYYAACGHAKFEKHDGRYRYHVEHVVPLARGGSNDISNIVLACPACNLHKHDKMPHEWLEGGRLL